MIRTTDSQVSTLVEAFGDMWIELVEGAAEIARESTKNYVTALNAIAEQQRLAYGASQHWFSSVASAQSNTREQLVASYDSAKGALFKSTEEATDVASEASRSVVEPSRKAAVSATRRQSKPLPRTSRRATPARSKSAPSDEGSPGPAKWTIEAYESLTAAEIVEQLPQLAQRELGEVQTYERSHQARQTVLQKITTLRGQEPVPGYDELNVQEIHKQLAEGDDNLAARVRDYERLHKSREGVLNAAEAQLNKS